ncbi:MAG: hypothetical protein J5I98_30170 [Phaeodactylibacter sp.]|nr:hypothetical protein [Phaeodactylibacter sp.]
MGRSIITTVGTSIFENFLLKFGGNTFSQLFDELKKAPTAYDFWQDRENDVRRYIRFPLEKKQYYRYDDLSAEIASIIAIQKELNEEVTVHLLATDTVLSVLAAELIKSWFESEKNTVKYPGVLAVNFDRPASVFEKQDDSKFIIRKLRIDQQSDFETGIMNLLKVLNSISTSESILNITGGYKGIVPIVTIWAQIKKVPLKYLFREKELDRKILPLTLENLPIDFDYALFEDNYIAFESIKPSKQDENLPSPEQFVKDLSNSSDFKILRDSYIIQENKGKIKLTPLGAILYQQYEKSMQDDGFSMSNLIGKVMEVKVFEYFQEQYPEDEVVLGKAIGKSPEGDAYDLDVFVQTEEMIWAIEVKPEGTSILIKEDMNKKDAKKTIEYKCKVGAFKCSLDQFNSKPMKLCLFMYHHQEPNRYQVENMLKLIQMQDNPSKDYLHWIWIKPKANYKGNVNWKIQGRQMKRFNFSTRQWENL